MGKKTGFLEFRREGLPARPPAQRINDWEPFYLPLHETNLERQAARCMDCGVPFCHTGVTLNGMTSGCPLNNLIPEWNDLVYRGLWREAYERLAKTNNFPEFTGLTCPAPCEAACTLGIVDPAVTIKNIEYAIVEKAFAAGWVEPARPARRTGRRVAVVGSGPAGLACADQLNRVGHDVTVFERAERPGGLLAYGIPNMKLAKSLVARRVDLLAAAGIRFVTGTEVGVSFPVAELTANFDAIILCTGATRPRDLDIPGRDLNGIHFATSYLAAANRRLYGHANGNSALTAAGKDVIVIGGGDTGTDCLATALRQGCRSLTQFEILPRPPAQRAPDNPWPQWPRTFEAAYGHVEAAARFGQDPRHFCTSATAFAGDGTGHVAQVHTVDVSWQPNGNGRPDLVTVPESECVWPAQLVLLALGFLGPEAPLLQQLGVSQNERSNIATPADPYATNVPGVFAAGDARRGQSLVVWAIHEGRGAARACDRYLMGVTDLP